jgi:hypothetical protein
MLPEFKVVYVRRITILEDKDQLVLRPIAGPLAGIGLGLYDEVLRLAKDRFARCHDFDGVTPIHEHKVDRAIDGIFGGKF